MKPVTRVRKDKSPTQLALADKCFAKWTARYIYGLKGDFLVGRGNILGTIMHVCLARFVEGGSVNGVGLAELSEREQEDTRAFVRNQTAWHQEKIARRLPKLPQVEVLARATTAAEKELAELFVEAPRRASTGLGYLPDRRTNMHVNAELPFKLNTVGWREPGASIITFSDMSKIDVLACSNPPGSEFYGEWFIYDHKSTAGDDDGPWSYVPTKAELADDVQFLLYLACGMDLVGAQAMWGRWVYYYTGKRFPPQAKPVDVYLTRQQVRDKLRRWFALADRMDDCIDQTYATGVLPDLKPLQPHVDVIHGENTPCFAYRKPCPYKAECQPPPKTIDQLITLVKQKPEHERPKSMSLEDRVSQQVASGAPIIPGMQPIPTPPGVVQQGAAPAPPAPPPTPPAPMSYAAALGQFGQEQANELFYAGQLVEQPTPPTAPTAPEAPAPAPEAPAPKKRKRRTKAEIAAQKAADAAASAAREYPQLGLTEFTMTYDKDGQSELHLNGVKLPPDFTVDRIEYPELGTSSCKVYLLLETGSCTISEAIAS